MAKPQKPPRNHHYVPQLLLRRFTASDGTLWVYDLEKSKIYPGHPESAGFVRDLYSRKGVNGSVNHSEVERLLAERVDTPGDAAIRKLLAREDLPTMGSLWNDFLIFVAAQLLRTPAYFDRTEAMMRPTAQEMLERAAKYDAEFRNGVRESALARGMTEREIEEHLEYVANGGFKVKPTKDAVISSSLSMLHHIFLNLQQLDWRIGTLVKSDASLVIGDNLAVHVRPKGEPVGLKHPGVQVMLPLSSRIAVIGDRTSMTAYVDFQPGDAERLNVETMRHAKRFLFASFRDERLLAQAKSLQGTGPKVRIRRVETENGLSIIHEYR